MKIFLAIIFIFMAVSVGATPFLTSNAQTGATTYQISGGPAWLPTSVAAVSGAMRVDLGPIAVPGTYNITARACRNDAIWGVQCGASGNYTLTCPTPPNFTAPILNVIP